MPTPSAPASTAPHPRTMLDAEPLFDHAWPSVAAVGLRHRPPWVDLTGRAPRGAEIDALGWVADRLGLDLKWVAAGDLGSSLGRGHIDIHAGGLQLTGPVLGSRALAAISVRMPAPSQHRGRHPAGDFPLVWLIRRDWPPAHRLHRLAQIYGLCGPQHGRRGDATESAHLPRQASFVDGPARIP